MVSIKAPRAKPSVVMVALCAAFASMIATAGVSVLAGEDLSTGNSMPGPSARIRGKRAVHVSAPTAPDTCVALHVPTLGELTDRAVTTVAPILYLRDLPPLRMIRPLHEADEVPENFI